MPAINLSRRTTGIFLAAGLAVISGFAVFVNGYGVRAWSEVTDAATYTTFKNIVAAALLSAGAIVYARRRRGGRTMRPQSARQWTSLLLIAVVGGSVPFLLFFEGLARASSAKAAFIHKTLVVWVTVMAIAFLKERIGPLHIAAVVLLVWGQAALLGGLTGFEVGLGELLMLGATLLWSVEVVIAKRVLRSLPPPTVAVARMAGGAVVLIIYAFATGAFAGLGALTASHLGWIALTGTMLTLYVATWFSALARAQAVDVTAMLVGGAVTTALLDTGVRGIALPSAGALGLLGAGLVLMFTAMALRPRMVR
jgi:drug/metabolite transporter (DMT)-like permease